MANQILKELLKVYSEIPVGMLVFKDKDLFFINQHLRETLMLGNMNVEESLNIFSKVLGIDPDQKKLCTFLQENNFFSYKEKYIQITSNNIDEYDVFIFTRIDQSLIQTIKETLDPSFVPIISQDINIPPADEQHKKLLEHFDKNKKQKVRAYSLYKGIPLIADNIIKQSYKNTLVIQIEDKQTIAAEKGNAWLFKISSGTVVEGTIIHVDKGRRLVFLSNLRKIKKGFHLRETIRYQSEEPMRLIIKCSPVEIELQILDLNESACRVVTNNQVILEKLYTLTNPTLSDIILNNQTITVKSTYLSETSHSQGEATVVMTFSCDQTQLSILRQWFNTKQIEIIKEVKEFSNSL